MSGVMGNFALKNYDHTAQTAGAGHDQGTAFASNTDSGAESYESARYPFRRFSSAAPKSHSHLQPVSADEKQGSSSSDDDVEAEKDKQREQAVVELARKYTNQSTYSSIDINPFAAEKDSILDPQSTNFRPRAWTKALLNLQAKDPDNFKERTAGFAFRDLNVHGYGSATDYQKTVANVILQGWGLVRKLMGAKERRIDILKGLDGIVHSGEMLVVLGPPGSGCTTFLKTVSGETHGFFVDDGSYINYQGISSKQFHKDFRGEAIYTAEVDVHFPQLSVGNTLMFAAWARSPRKIPGGVSRKTYSEHMRDVIMAMFGISHTLHTPVGNDFIRGVSGGERKRVTIAEAALSAAPLQCWDNSTRGLDSANAIEFCRTVRMSTDLSSTTAAVAIYQSPQSAYDIFDKVLVLYEGHQIYFGRAGDAQAFFEDMGFECPDRQTVPDFLTSMTSPQERRVRAGFEGKTPRTPEEFAARWKSSPDYARLQEELRQYDADYPVGGDRLKQFQASRRAQQSKWQRVGSAYTLSYWGQIMLCVRRGFWRLKGDPSVTLTQLFGNGIMALIIASVFYNLQPDTNSFFSRGAILFFAILLNAFGSSLEILTLYAQRPIVEKHTRYAFYHPSCEAFASMLTDMPYKVLNAIVFNIALYFLVNLRREPGAFFFYLLIGFILTLAMSMLFRTIASVSRTLSQAMAPAAVLTLGIVMYTGFAMPVPYMRGWARWMQYVDVVSFAFESLMVNEFYGRNFTCSMFVPTGPGYNNVDPLQHVCSTVGAVAGSDIVDGGVYIATLYQYYHGHKWRNLGIIIVFMIGLCIMYLAATEYITAKKSKGEVLVFRRGHQPASLTKNTPDDMEAATGRPISMAKPEKNLETTAAIRKQTAIFHWQDVCYDIKVKGGPRRILDHVDGWVRPGTLTALMGVSGAGKTTLLDCLASRTTFGVISGEMLVDGRQRDTSFQRKTGYVQQQDLHLATSTVREALVFSALLRQPATIPRKEQIAYVDEVIKLLDMEEYADAVVGVPGEGLNVEQRKRLTIGVELAAKPELLLFLDEPTSGLDSQTSWAICDLMEKLTRNGVSILCTIHQPSAMLFQRFDRLLFLQKGGQTVYFGEVGKDAAILRKYFESNGAPECPPGANPAEWMMEITGAAPGSVTDKDWFSVWRNSTQYAEVQSELERLKIDRPKETPPSTQANDKTSYREFAAHFPKQFLEVTKRVFEQYWRTPSYIYSKLLLSASSSIYIGFSFYNEGTSQQGLQNQMFAIFMLFLIFLNFVQQIMPHFVTQRSLYEARERPSKTYSWKAFMLSNILVELPWNCLMGVIIFFCWYYPIGLYKNAEYTDTVHERGALMFLLALQFILFASTFTDMVIAAIPTAETAGNVAQLIFSLTLIFCGVLASPTALPGFWIFMYRLSPLNYLTSAMLSTGLANAPVKCAANEILRFNPPAGQSCQEYMFDYMSLAGGYLENPNSTSQCRFCSASSTNTFLTAVSANYDDRWRNFGILWAYIIFNVAAAILLYWAFRVPKDEKKRRKEIQAEKKGKRRSMLVDDKQGIDEKEKDLAV